MVTTVLFEPSDGFTRVTLLPVFSVTQRKPSGPQVISHGSAKPVVRTREVNGSREGVAVDDFSWEAVHPVADNTSRVVSARNRFMRRFPGSDRWCVARRTLAPDRD